MNLEKLENRLFEISNSVEAEKEFLDPNISGQDDKINKIEEIEKHLDTAQISLREYIILKSKY